MAILAYLTLIGFIVAVVMHGSKKTRLGAFHLRQALGLMITSIVLWFAIMIMAFIPFIGWMISISSFVLWLGLFILWILGLIAAASGELKELPVVGDHYQKWFKTAFE